MCCIINASNTESHFRINKMITLISTVYHNIYKWGGGGGGTPMERPLDPPLTMIQRMNECLMTPQY